MTTITGRIGTGMTNTTVEMAGINAMKRTVTNAMITIDR